MAKANSPITEYNPPLNRQTNEELLAVFDIYRFSRQQLEQIRVSPDNRHIAFIDHTFISD